MSGQCKECRYWDAKYGHDHLPNAEYDRHRRVGRWAMCERSGKPDSLLCLSDRFESVETHADFGCVMFELRVDE